MHMKVQSRLMQMRFIEIHQVFAKIIRSDTSVTVPYCLQGIPMLALPYLLLGLVALAVICLIVFKGITHLILSPREIANLFGNMVLSLLVTVQLAVRLSIETLLLYGAYRVSIQQNCDGNSAVSRAAQHRDLTSVWSISREYTAEL